MSLPPTDGYTVTRVEASIRYTPTGAGEAGYMTLVSDLMSYPTPVEQQYDAFIAAAEAVKTAFETADPTGTVEMSYEYHGTKFVAA